MLKLKTRLSHVMADGNGGVVQTNAGQKVTPLTLSLRLFCTTFLHTMSL
jgi:hypothetical protein